MTGGRRLEITDLDEVDLGIVICTRGRGVADLGIIHQGEAGLAKMHPDVEVSQGTYRSGVVVVVRDLVRDDRNINHPREGAEQVFEMGTQQNSMI